MGIFLYVSQRKGGKSQEKKKVTEAFNQIVFIVEDKYCPDWQVFKQCKSFSVNL